MEEHMVAHYRRLLLDKQQELMAATTGSVASTREMGDNPADIIDKATAKADDVVRLRLRQAESHLLRAIEEALRRSHGENFRRCEVCGEPISKVRLEAVPWTRVCRECKESEKQ
jgi:DnaK suppressor protein